MPTDTKLVSWAEIRKEESAEIVKRRQRADLPQSDGASVERDTVGVGLSGGGLRSAAFSLGIVQALIKCGLWRHVDFLSTVSGGGYFGSFLSTLVLKYRQFFSSENCPLLPGSDGAQPPEVQRTILGGRRLLKTWELINRYLVGVVLLNASILSGVITLCALTAFLWRCLDLPAVRERARLLDLVSDFQAPFIPAILLGICWLTAWGVSLWRRGSEASGTTARYCLVLFLFSLLIAVSLLLGNGDIGFGGFDYSLLGGKTIEPSSSLGASLIALVLGGLLPLQPRRLIESGLQGKKDGWERVVFGIASVALLVGMPVVCIGIFARENISGYNTHPHRDLIWQDIENWPILLAIIAPSPTESFDGQQREAVWTIRKSLTDLPFDGRRPDLQRRKSRFALLEKLSGKSSNEGKPEPDRTPGKSIDTSDPEPTPKSPQPIEMRMAQYVEADPSSSEDSKHDVESLIKGLRDDPLQVDAHSVSKAFPQDEFKQLIGLAIVLEEQLRLQNQYDVELNDLGHWSTAVSFRLPQRLFKVVGFWTGIWHEGNPARDLWIARQSSEQIQERIARDLNSTVLSNTEAIKNNVASKATKADGKIEGQAQLAALTDVSTWPNYRRHELGRLLLQEQFPTVFRDRAKIRRKVCIVEDQRTRLAYAGMAFLVFVATGLIVNVNLTSLHRYYRNRLEQAFLVPLHSSLRPIAISELRTTSYGAPYHLISATVRLFGAFRWGRQGSVSVSRSSDGIENSTVLTPFLFSRLVCGSRLTGFARTEEYERHSITLADAIALSGAAVTPGLVPNPLISLLMFVLNLRLGQWLPHPRVRRLRWWPTLLSLMWAQTRSTHEPSYCFVTDGGHSDNLGLLQLLERRCALIISVDAGHDPKFEFEDLAHVIRVARLQHGIRLVEFDASISPTTTENLPDFKASALRLHEEDPIRTSDRHFLMARVLYPDAPEGLLVYVKPSLTGDESVDVQQYRVKCPEFPHETSSDQLFDEQQMESYRQLGFHIGRELCRLLPPVRDGGNLSSHVPAPNAAQLVDWFVGREGCRTTVTETPTDVEIAAHFHTVPDDAVARDGTPEVSIVAPDNDAPDVSIVTGTLQKVATTRARSGTNGKKRAAHSNRLRRKYPR